MKFEEIQAKLLGFGVPADEIAPIEERLVELDTVLAKYNELMKPKNQKTLRENLALSMVRRKLKGRQEALSTHVIGLLKLYTGYRVIVVWGGARIKPTSPAYIRMVEAISKAGPNTIVIDGCGPGIMEAAMLGAQDAKAIRIGLRMVSNKAFETTLDASENRWAEGHTFCFDHHDFYSRVAAFLEFADAVIIGESGIGGTQEKAWVEGSIQCGMMNPIPVFVFSPDYWEGSRAHFNNMLKAGAVSDEDRDLIRFVPEGEEVNVYDRIKQYYAARPHLLCAAEPAVKPTDVNSVELAAVTAVSDVEPVAVTPTLKKRKRVTKGKTKGSKKSK
ncbi:MAG: LOG family protein [Candidatus Obscuribacterales bacterium]|nr:LOG family protein [Candidatus Obscuribacterales bacterium]